MNETSDRPRPKSVPEHPIMYCHFCGKTEDEVQKLIAGPVAHICNECVDMCNDIIAEESRFDGRMKKAGSVLALSADEVQLLEKHAHLDVRAFIESVLDVMRIECPNGENELEQFFKTLDSLLQEDLSSAYAAEIAQLSDELGDIDEEDLLNGPTKEKELKRKHFRLQSLLAWKENLKNS